jgi:hypothetical protein
MRRLAAGLLAATIVLSGCGGTSSSDAERVISQHSSGRLSGPECVEVGRDFKEYTYHCTAGRPEGHRIKLLVDLVSDAPDNGMILAWPCVPAREPWRAIRQRHFAQVVWEGEETRSNSN